MHDPARVEIVPERMGTRTRILATIFVIGCIVFWIFAFSPQARDIFVAPDGLEDTQLVEQIEFRCRNALVELDEVPSARTAETPLERARIIAVSTQVYRSMAQDIGALDGGTDADRELLGLWLDDWDIYLGDRDHHEQRLVDEGDVRFLTTEENGVFINERMNGFSRRNHIDSCQTPGDL